MILPSLDPLPQDQEPERAGVLTVVEFGGWSSSESSPRLRSRPRSSSERGDVDPEDADAMVVLPPTVHPTVVLPQPLAPPAAISPQFTPPTRPRTTSPGLADQPPDVVLPPQCSRPAIPHRPSGYDSYEERPLFSQADSPGSMPQARGVGSTVDAPQHIFVNPSLSLQQASPGVDANAERRLAPPVPIPISSARMPRHGEMIVIQPSPAVVIPPQALPINHPLPPQEYGPTGFYPPPPAASSYTRSSSDTASPSPSVMPLTINIPSPRITAAAPQEGVSPGENDGAQCAQALREIVGILHQLPLPPAQGPGQERPAGERSTLEREREQLLREREQLLREREQFSREREQLMREREQFVRERELVSRERELDAGPDAPRQDKKYMSMFRGVQSTLVELREDLEHLIKKVERAGRR